MNAAGLPAAATALAGAVRGMAADPADQVRLLLQLAAVTDDGPSGRLVRRSALTQLARACADYQPTSFDDAQGLRITVCALLDDEVLRAGDAGDDAVYAAFRALRLAVARDLSSRGDPLPSLRRVQVRRSLPGAVLAHALFGDGRRADEIVAKNPVVHPLFCPLDLTVLAR